MVNIFNNIDDIKDIVAESGVVSTLIFHPEFIAHSEYLDPRYFTDKTYHCLYWAIRELYKQGVTNIDEVNLITQMNTNTAVKQKIEQVGIHTISDVLKYANCVARSTVEEYKALVNKVVELAFKRDLYMQCGYIQGLCLNEQHDLGSLYRETNNVLVNLSDKYLIGAENAKKYGDIIDDVWQQICKRRNKNGTYGFQWKFPTLNEYCPMEKGELIVLAGKRKKGKSMVMLNQCIHSITNGIACLYIDTELTDLRFTERLLANMTGIPIKRIKNGNYTDSEAQMLAKTREYIKTLPFVHYYMPGASMDETYAICKTLQYQMGLQQLFFDYIKDSTSKDLSSQYSSLGNMTNYLKNEIAGKLNLSVVAGAQLNRKDEIGDSYKIEQYASTVLNVDFKDINRRVDDGEECGNYMLWVKLNRNGDQHVFDEGEYIDLQFNTDRAIIEETAKQHTVIMPFN